MYKNIIKNNIFLLNSDLTKGFFKTKNIILDDNESSIITELIINNIDNLLNRNYQDTFNILRVKVKKETYEKVRDLYLSTNLF